MRRLLITSLLLLGGCSVWAPVEVAPESPLPGAPAWQQPHIADAMEPVAEPWLQHFADSRLEALVSEALASNPTLRVAEFQLRESRFAADVAGAAEQPSLDANFQGGRARRAGTSSDSFSAGLNAAWELDLWQRLSRAAQAAVTDRDALAADLRAARLSLAANVAKGWFLAVEARQQQQLSERLVANLEQSLEVLESGYRAGLVAALDIHLARANLATERSRLADRRSAVGDRLRELETLLGRYPGRALVVDAQLPPLPPAVPVGLPSQLLARRADIRAAELRLVAAGLRQDAAHADRFPRISLTGSLGGSSDELGQLLSGDSLVWSLFGNLAQPLFDGGRLEALEGQAASRFEQAQERYRATLLQAFSEVEGALEQESELRNLVASLALGVAESDLAEQLAYEQYRRGLVDIVTVLEAQRRAFNARSAYIAARNRQLQTRINLHLALGGDFAAAPSQQTGNTDD
ncbi:efflux transporter outer membrane subunit [Motiliproteus sediminis]|uniref:efflux transporter outer membrane subunit n=1 Tax=Motiliproteus sediminis TaxID=1468178 RepID=UPI001AEF380F|nr:efflux transporter outer membrane subunit [Motiliproteus sediminis]